MVRDIERRKTDYANISFVIVSGDLAYDGKPEQYRLVEKFLDELIGVLGLSRSDVFMVPGNHDIDRDLSELTFHGTRAEFVNAENVERYLANANEL
jgi:metallophosphoesterase superfamily enzyme